MNIPPEFAHEFDLDSLQLLTPRGRDFSMYVTPRYRMHYERELYEPLTADLLTSILRRTELFLDVGASYGFFAMLASTKHAELDIIAVEPTPVTCEVLARNVRLLDRSKIEVRQVAISDFVGRAQFNVALASDSCGFYEHPNAATIRSIEVETTTVDALLKNRQPCPLVVKIDTEGNELAVLKGMAETLNRFPDLKMIVEFNPATLQAAGVEPPALLRYLDRLGFTVYMIDDNRRRFYRMTPAADWTALMMYGYSNLYCVRREQALSVCFVSHSSGLMGAERILLELVDDLIGDHGTVCNIVLPRASLLIAKFEALGAACIVSEYGWWCSSARETLTDADRKERLRESVQGLMRTAMPELRTFDPDVVWTQTMVIPWGAMLAAKTGKPHVWYVLEYGKLDHGLDFFSPLSTVTQEVVQSSDLVFVLSRSLADSLFLGTPPDRVRLLYCHVPPPADAADVPEGDYFRVPGAVRLGIFSQVRPSKGQDDIVQATAQLVARGNNVELLIAGPGYPDFVDYLNGLARSGGIEDRVNFVNFLENPYPAMRACDIVIVCSRAEALGRVGIEAMHLAKPVIYPMAGGVPEYMVDGETGLSYVPGDVPGLVARLEELIGAPARWPIMGACGRIRAGQLFSKDKFTGEVFRTLQEIRRQGRTAGGMPNSIAEIVAEVTKIGMTGHGAETMQGVQANVICSVKSQYENFPYPPRDPEDERKRLVETQGGFLDIVNFHCYGGREDFAKGFRVLVAGCGTGDAAVFLAEQLRETGGEVVALDFSEASLAIARRRSEVRALTNVRFVRAPIQDIPSLALGLFDFIDCSGVLHHLADPDEGLRSLAGALKESGAMHLMVYGAHGRAPIYPMQELLRSVAGPEFPAAERMARARRLLEHLPESNAFKREFGRVGQDIVQYGDAGLYDLLLHARDRAYTVPQVYAWLEQAGLRLAAFDAYGGGGKVIYEPATYLRDPGLLNSIRSKPAAERQAIAELIAGDMARHACFATKNSVPPPSPEQPEAIPFIPAAWAEDDIYGDLHRQFSEANGKPVTIGFRDIGRKLTYAPTAHTALIFKHLDGERGIGEVLRCVKEELATGAGEPGRPEPDLMAQFRALYEAFNAMDWMLLRLPGSRRMRSGRVLQTSRPQSRCGS